MTYQLKRAVQSAAPPPRLTKVEPLPAPVKERLEDSSSPLVAAFVSLAIGPRIMEILKLIQILIVNLLSRQLVQRVRQSICLEVVSLRTMSKKSANPNAMVNPVLW